MKRIVVIMMMLLCIAGCRSKKEKNVLTQSDLKQDIISDTDVDWIGLYIRCHELDSIKNVAEETARKGGHTFAALPDSVPELWNGMMGDLLMRNGDNAFATYDSHRKDIADYLRMDFINYGFITKVYLPYKAMKSTREEYGDICIKELETEFDKAQMNIYYTGQTPSHYENLLMDLFYAYLNYEHNDKALGLCDMILQYLESHYGSECLSYANMLSNKANLCNNMGSAYSASVAAKRAIGIYDKILSESALDESSLETAKEEKKKMEDKLQLWQKKK